MIEYNVKDAALRIIESVTGKYPQFIAYSPVSGGCINQAGKITTTAGLFFVKSNISRKAEMFRKEIMGLVLLAKNTKLKVPQVVGFEPDYKGSAVLVMQWIEPARKHLRFWKNFGQGLADMHKSTQGKFGLDEDNYIGSLPQSNTQHEKWVDFFIEERIENQLQIAENDNPAIAAELRDQFQRLYPKLPEIFPDEKPALLHGDLWSGNFIAHTGNQAVLIDPAAYYGNREMEIAFTSLFGGFSSAFYEAYNEAWPLENGFQKRKDIYNLYPLLVHYNLFGRGYLTSIKLILKNF